LTLASVNHPVIPDLIRDPAAFGRIGQTVSDVELLTVHNKLDPGSSPG